MAAINAFAQDAVDRAESLTVAAAYAQCRDAALAESAIGAIGLEIESHLVDLDQAARDGLANAALATSVRRCLAIAAGRVPAELRPVVADLADLVESGRCPGDLLAERAGGAAEYTAGTFRQAC